MTLASFPVVDVIFAITMLAVVFTGWSLGAVAATMNLIGVIIGATVGWACAPYVMGFVDGQPAQIIAGIVTLLVFTLIGHAAASTIGYQLRGMISNRALVVLDAAGGALIRGVTTVLLVWLILTPLSTTLPGDYGRAIRESYTVQTMARYTPQWAAELPNRLTSIVTETGLPEIFAPPGLEDIPDAGPLAGDVDAALVAQVQPSVIKILAEADSCSRLLAGSGFAIAPDRVMTNAHVVAGARVVRIQANGGTLDAEVVHFDPALDVAVLAVPGGTLTPVSFAAEPASNGTDVAVMGYPRPGNFEAAAGRVRDRVTVQLPDLYGVETVTRDSYAIAGTIRSGNSGGPVFTLTGEVIGMVYASSVEDNSTGFALTLAEFDDLIVAAPTLHTSVDTGACLSDATISATQTQ